MYICAYKSIQKEGQKQKETISILMALSKFIGERAGGGEGERDRDRGREGEREGGLS